MLTTTPLRAAPVWGKIILGGVETSEDDRSGRHPVSTVAFFMPEFRSAHVPLWREGEEYNTRKGNNSARKAVLLSSSSGFEPPAASGSVESPAVGAHSSDRRTSAMGATNPTPENLPPITYRETRVITTDLLAAVYGTGSKNIHDNFANQADRFAEGKHFFRVEGDDLRAFKNYPENFGLVDKRARHLILWTERGAARHAKMLDTDQAWEVFEKLEDAYFRQALAPSQDRAIVKVKEHLRRVSTSRATATRLEALVERLERCLPPDAPPLIPMPSQPRRIAGYLVDADDHNLRQADKVMLQSEAGGYFVTEITPGGTIPCVAAGIVLVAINPPSGARYVPCKLIGKVVQGRAA